jgi:hypothetical protein
VAIDQIAEWTAHLFAELMDLFAASLDFPSREGWAKRKCRSLFLAYFGKVTTFGRFYFSPQKINKIETAWNGQLSLSFELRAKKSTPISWKVGKIARHQVKLTGKLKHKIEENFKKFVNAGESR